MAQPALKPDFTAEIIVIGAGLAGLAASLALSQQGFSVALVGPNERVAGGRTVALLAPSMRFLAALGLAEAARSLGAPLRRLRIIDDKGGLIRAPSLDFRATEMGFEAFGWNVENAALADLIEAAARTEAAIVRIAGTAQAIHLGEDGASVTLGDGRTGRASLLVGADGRRSPTRRAAGIDESVHAYGQSALTGIFSHARPHGGVSIELHKRGGPFTLVPLPAGPNAAHRSSLVWAMAERDVEAVAGLDDARWAARVEAEAHCVFGAMAFDRGRGRFPLQRSHALRFHARRLALIGEAAHALPPIGAQGFNLSLRDIAALAESTGEARRSGDDFSSGALLAAYDRGRRADVGVRAFAVDALNRSLLSDFLPFDAARAGAFAALASVAPLRRAAMRGGLGA